MCAVNAAVLRPWTDASPSVVDASDTPKLLPMPGKIYVGGIETLGSPSLYLCWKQTIDHYCIIMYKHTMLVAGVFLFKELKTCPKMFQNRTKMTFSQTHAIWTYIKLNTILMRFFNKF